MFSEILKFHNSLKNGVLLTNDEKLYTHNTCPEEDSNHSPSVYRARELTIVLS